MPTPEAFVRYYDVTIKDCQDKALIEFLRNANESFIGCRLTLGQYDHSLSNDTQAKLAFLLSHVFLRPTKIWMNLNCASSLQQIMQKHEKNKAVQSYGRMLDLGRYPRRMFVDMVERLKQAFQDDNSPPASYLITFPGSEAGLEEGDHSFSLDKVSTGEKLSFFAKNRTGDVCLWRRRVTCKTAEWMMEYQYNRKTVPRDD
ncbi:hypothetical protein DdX_20262 [Ditylenchus destructor]|uniref:Uncharacterized protein n=1 Tax=Ditylenchus destructor TaxID=166010 RepID=A0AAD4MLP4_9BILA|nr:hypothetical protein DdX_20262 [Ditylenchus destructor]